MPIEFTKFHGYGNDYIVIDAHLLTDVSDLGKFANTICKPHYGAGADGIAVVSPSETPEADFRVRIFNPDGSEAGLSGNGTRCAAAFLFYENRWSNEALRLITRSGVKRYFLRERLGDGDYLFESELGQPKFRSDEIPMLTGGVLERVLDYPLGVAGINVPVTALQVGNPHCCIFVNDFGELDWWELGPLIENHEQFPERTNVIFIRVIDRSTIELRVWERGVGHTTASGTCSSASAIASMIHGKVDRRVKAVMEGGDVKIHWREDHEVVLTGVAQVSYRGEWLAGF